MLTLRWQPWPKRVGRARPGRTAPTLSLRADAGPRAQQEDGAHAAARPWAEEEDEDEDEELREVEDAYDLPPMAEVDDAENDEESTRRPQRGRVRQAPPWRKGQPRRAGDWKGQHLWYVTLNANGLSSKTTGKAVALGILLQNQELFGRPYPDIVTVTEVQGPSGGVALRELLGETLCNKYSIHWSLRSVESDGRAIVANRAGRVGGGICIMVHKRLNMSARRFNIDVNPDHEPFLDGHVRSWRLDPNTVPRGQLMRAEWPQRSLVVTVAYVPPANDAWGKPEHRKLIFDTVQSAEKSVKKLRVLDDVFAVSMLHWNAYDGACPVPLGVEATMSDEEVARGLAAAEDRYTRSKQPGARLVKVKGQPVEMHRVQSRATRKNDKADPRASEYEEGRRVTLASAKLGMIAVDGVTGPRHPTSWTGCTLCTQKDVGDNRCVCDKYNRRSVHDIVRVPTDLIWRALTAPDNDGSTKYIKVRVERGGPDNRPWSDAVDHCVTAVRLFVGPSTTHQDEDPASADAAPAVAKAAPRLKQPAHLLFSYMTKKTVATETDKLMNALPHNGGVNEAEAAMVAALEAARVVGQERAAELVADGADQEPSRGKRIRMAQSAYKKARAALHNALLKRAEEEGEAHAAECRRRAQTHRRKAHQRGPAAVAAPAGVASAATARAVQEANKNWRQAHAAMLRATKIAKAMGLQWRHTHEPKAAWKEQHAMAKDAGAPDDEVNKLLQCQTDENGQVITRDQRRIMQNVEEFRKMVFQVRSDLSPECEDNISEALQTVHQHNETLYQDGNFKFNDASVVAQTAKNALAVWGAIDARRGKPARNLKEVMAARHQRAESDPGHKLPAFRKRDAVHAKFAEAHKKLNATWTVTEVAAAMHRMKDVGRGTDGVEPMLFMGHMELHHAYHCKECSAAGLAQAVEAAVAASNGAPLPVAGDDTCATAQQACDLFNAIREGGCIPERWKKHRCILHYKGKDSDPHCLDNYRGLGIDQALLKLLSLVMLERLDAYLTETNGLSRAQGGFQRQRGPPEQVLTLLETVRATLRHKNVHIGFIDIERAYDSVQHPILWQRCIEKGIDGPFLATLQAIYYEAEAQVDLGGVLLTPAPLECGVLQGNPLSPPLFNIYLDGALEALDEASRCERAAGGRPFGVPLPRVQARGTVAPIADAARDHSDFLSQLFFADDGAVVDTDRATLQRMLDMLAKSLADIGLSLNTKKTKWMMAAKLSSTANAYELDKGSAVRTPLCARNVPVELVDEFSYLGFRLSWRWDTVAAWAGAVRRCNSALHKANQGGFDRNGTLATMLKHAHGKIWCHLSYIAAMAGAGGTDTTAPYRGAQTCIRDVLRKIAGYPFVNTDAIQIEAGVWDQRTRVDMLLLRFWCKIAVSDLDSLPYRAVCLSIREWSEWRSPSGQVVMFNRDPTRINARTDQLHYQPWGQQLAAAATRFGLHVPQVLAMKISAVVQLQTCTAGAAGWVDVDMDNAGDVAAATAVFGPTTRMQLLASNNGRTVKYFPFCENGAARLNTVATYWTEPLRDACFAALKARGNTTRQALVQEFCAKQIQEDKSLRRWATFTGYSGLHAYWYATDLVAARRLLRLRLDVGPNEDNIRRMPHSMPKPTGASATIRVIRAQGPNSKRRHKTSTHATGSTARVVMPRLARNERVCYCCEQPPGEPETLEHMLLRCTNPALVAARAATRASLVRLAASEAARALADEANTPPPDFANDTALLFALLQCNGLGTPPRLQPMHAGVEVFDKAVATQTIRWTGLLTRDWVSKTNEPRTTDEELDNAPGGVLVAEMTAHALEVFRLHRRAVRNNDAYRRRDHDPAGALAAGRQPAAAPRRPIIIRSLSVLAARKKKISALRNQARNKKGHAPLPAPTRRIGAGAVVAATRDSGAVRLHVPALRLAARAQNRRVGPVPRPAPRAVPLPRPRATAVPSAAAHVVRLAANLPSSAQTAATGMVSNHPT